MSREREVVKGLYPGKNWQKTVAKMPEEQVVAIYIRHKAEVARKVKRKQDKKLREDS